MAGGEGFTEAYYNCLAGQLAQNSKIDLSKVYMLVSLVTMIAASIGSWITLGICSMALATGEDVTEPSRGTSTPIWICTAAFTMSWVLLSRYQK